MGKEKWGSGQITPEMNEFKRRMDVALTAHFDQRVSGRWVFRPERGDNLVWVWKGEPVPEGVEPVEPNEDGGFYPEGLVETRIPYGESIPFGFIRIRDDAEGTWVRPAGAKLRYRFATDGSFVDYDDDTTHVASHVDVDHAHSEDTHNIPVTTILGWDRETGRTFASGGSGMPADVEQRVRARNDGGLHVDGDLSRPDPEYVEHAPKTASQSIDQALARFGTAPVAPWLADPDDPLHPRQRQLSRQTPFPPVDSDWSPADGEPVAMGSAATESSAGPEVEQAPPSTGERRPGCLTPWLLYTAGFLIVLALIAGAVVWLTGGDDGDEAQPPRTPVASPAAPAAAAGADEATDDPAAAPTPSDRQDGSDRGDAGDADETDDADATADVGGEPLERVLSVLGPVGASAVTTLHVQRTVDPPGGSNSETSGLAGIDRAVSAISAVWVVRLVIAELLLQAAFNQSSYPCGAATADYRVTCPLGAAQLEPGEYVVVGVELEAPVDSDPSVTRTYGLYFDDDGDDTDNFQFVPPFDESFIRNTEHWYQLQVDPDGTRTMWADGVRDGVPGHPRHSSALVVERGSTLLWIVPRSEIPGEPLAYRASASSTSGDPNRPPQSGESGGDVSGASATEPLIPVEVESVEVDDVDALPPDVDGTAVRAPVDANPDAQLSRALVAEFEARMKAAIASGDVEQIVGVLHPQLQSSPNLDACRAEIEASLALADSVAITTVPDRPEVASGYPLYLVQGRIDYPSGPVDWPAALLPGPRGRLFLVLASCLEA